MEIKTELEKLSKEGLVDLTGSLAWNDAFGCFTRAGFEKLVWPQIGEKAEWIIYFDINGMHALNELHGSYDPVDAMIKNVLAVTRATDFVAGQWKSGDEFLVCVTQADDRAPVEPQGMVNRPTRHGQSTRRRDAEAGPVGNLCNRAGGLPETRRERGARHPGSIRSEESARGLALMK